MAALRNEEKVWVNGEIATAIQEHLHPHGWRKLSLFLKTWIPLGTAIGVLVALLALAGAGCNYAFSRVEKETQFQTHTTDALKQIDPTLIGLQTSITLMQAQIAAQSTLLFRRKS